MADDTDKNAQVQSEQSNPPSSSRVAGDSISVGVGAAAKNVAAGKNIVQIGSLSIPRWMALFTIAVLALVAVLAGVVAYFSQQTGASTQKALAILAYTPTPAPTSTATPLPFAPAADGETMILILPFHSTGANDSEPHKKIWRRIQAILAEMPNKSVTTVIDPNTVLTADQQAEAERVGKRYNASMVIWGEDTGVELIASFLNLREPDFVVANVDIQETQRTAIAANPEPYREFVLHELPGELAFLSLFAIGQTYYSNSDYRLAIDTIESAVAEVSVPNEKDTGEPTAAVSKGLAYAYFLLGWLYGQAPADWDVAIANYDRAIALDPLDADAYNNRGSAYYTKGDLDLAIADYNQAVTLDPLDADAYNNRGSAYYTKGDLDLAIADYNQAITLDPKYALAYDNRGIAYSDRGDLDLAIADYNQAIATDPKNADAFNNRGLAYYAKGDLDLAIADYNQAITLDPKYALVYNNRGLVYNAKGEPDEAIANYNRAISLDPKYAAAYNNRGNVYDNMGDSDQAMADYNMAITLNPQDAVAYNNRGLVYGDKGDLDRAIADYTQAVSLDPSYAQAYSNRGGTFYAKGDLDHAIADYTQAITVDPQYDTAYNSLCWSLALQQKPEQAITYCEKAVSHVDDPNYIDSRGSAHALLGDFPSAVADFQFFVDWLAKNYPDETQLINQRRDWIEKLTWGENPFTPDVLEELKNQ